MSSILVPVGTVKSLALQSRHEILSYRAHKQAEVIDSILEHQKPPSIWNLWRPKSTAQQIHDRLHTDIDLLSIFPWLESSQAGNLKRVDNLIEMCDLAESCGQGQVQLSAEDSGIIYEEGLLGGD